MHSKYCEKAIRANKQYERVETVRTISFPFFLKETQPFVLYFSFPSFAGPCVCNRPIEESPAFSPWPLPAHTPPQWSQRPPSRWPFHGGRPAASVSRPRPPARASQAARRVAQGQPLRQEGGTGRWDVLAGVRKRGEEVGDPIGKLSSSEEGCERLYGATESIFEVGIKRQIYV